MSEQLYVGIALCETCNAEIGRTHPVPENQKIANVQWAKYNCFCKIKAHNTYSDLNLNYHIEWVEA